MRTMALAMAMLAQTADPYAALRVYAGTWQVTQSGQTKPDTLVNECAQLGSAYACGQTVGGKPGGLVVFIAQNDKPGHFKTQTIMPDGRASGIVDLQVTGDQWAYTSRRDEYGKTRFYRTLNNFTGRNRIHFESAHSSDGSKWTVDGSGEEVRTAKGK